MKQIVFIFLLFVPLALVAQTPDTCGCTVNSSLPVGKLTFMCYNLGANPNLTLQQQMDYVPVNEFDATVYGDLYQWGRNTDGHEKRNSPTTNVLSTTDVPGHGNFIVTNFSDSNRYGDWRIPRNNNLWGTIKTSNDPCPKGWRMPTLDEWHSIHNNGASVNNTWIWNNTGTPGYKISTDGGVTFSLFLPLTGMRHFSDIIENMDEGSYWSSYTGGVLASNVWFSINYIGIWSYASNARSYGLACRCVKYCEIDTTIYRTICEGETYYFNGTNISTSGIYNEHITTINDCDSIVTLNLTVLPLNKKTINTSICLNKTYHFNGKTYNKAGTYTDTIAGTGTECDTVVTLNISTVTNTKTINAVICSNKTYNFNGKTYNTAGTYTDTISGAACDTLVTLNLTVNQVITQTENLKICLKELPYTWRDTVFKAGTSSGNYVFTRQSAVGCDSIITLHLTVNQEKTTNLSATIEQGEIYAQNGFKIPVQNNTGIFTFTQNLQTIHGCDSTVTLTLTVAPKITIEVSPAPEICGDAPNFTIHYSAFNILNVSVTFDDKVTAAGFVDIKQQNPNNQSITITLPKDIRPDNYSCKIIFESNSGLIKEIPLDFTVLYPASVIVQKWNDVLVIYNEKYNGGYTFSAFEWWKNGVQILGESGSYIYVQPALDFTAEYRARLTRADDGVTLFTCAFAPVFNEKLIQIQNPTLVPANQYFTFAAGEHSGKITIVNMQGLPVSEQKFVRGENQILAPRLQGVYVMIVSNDAGYSENMILTVK